MSTEETPDLYEHRITSFYSLENATSALEIQRSDLDPEKSSIRVKNSATQ